MTSIYMKLLSQVMNIIIRMFIRTENCFVDFFCFIKLKWLYVLVPMIVLGFQCKSSPEYECDYISISKEIVVNIKNNKPSKIKRLMAFEDKGFWEEGSRWATIRNGAGEILDTISNLSELKYTLQYNKNSKISYAIVTFIINENFPITDVIEVRFLHPSSPLHCKVQSFEYFRHGSSNKIDSEPIADSSKVN